MALGSAAVITFIATTDATHSRSFYETALGLTFVADEPYALSFDLGGTMLRVQKVESLTPATSTTLGWRVDDIASEIADLSSRGVRFEHFVGLQQDEPGIWTTPDGSIIAWFKDPYGNLLSLTQFAT